MNLVGERRHKCLVPNEEVQRVNSGSQKKELLKALSPKEDNRHIPGGLDLFFSDIHCVSQPISVVCHLS